MMRAVMILANCKRILLIGSLVFSTTGGAPAAPALNNNRVPVAGHAESDVNAAGDVAAPAVEIEDPGGRALRHFYATLTDTCRGETVTRILHYGDSHVAADLLTGALRRQLQGCFGDGGAGLVLGGKPYSYY